MNVKKNVFEVIQERRLKCFEHIKRMTAERIQRMMMVRTAECKIRGKPKERMGGMRRDRIRRGLIEEVEDREAYREEKLIWVEGKLRHCGELLNRIIIIIIIMYYWQCL